LAVLEECSVKISVAGEDVTQEIEGVLKSISRQRGSLCADDARACEVLKMKEAGSAGELASAHMEALRKACFVDTAQYQFDGQALGGILRAARKAVWSILRPVIEWIVHRQNNINAQVVQAIELQKNEFDRELAELRKDIESLKSEKGK
jgi:hypothetical protein